MAEQDEIVVGEEPAVSADDVWDFYVDNNCCEQQHGKEKATSVLARSDLIVTARDRGKLVGIARAIDDGLDAHIMELSVALSHQGEGARYQTGALVEDDRLGVGRRLAQALVDGLLARGVLFIGATVFGTETELYKKSGFAINEGHVVMYIDKRPPWNG